MTKDELIKLGVSDDIAEKVLNQHTAELTAETNSRILSILPLTASLSCAKFSIMLFIPATSFR